MRVWPVALLAGLVGFALARWLAEPGTDRVTTPSINSAGVAANGASADPNAVILAELDVAQATSASASGESGNPQTSLTPEAPATDGPKLALDAVAFLREWPARLDELATRARAGDARALTDLAEALDYCSAAGGAITRARYAPAQAGNLADTGVQAYFAEVDGQCKAWRQRHPWLDQLARDARTQMQEHLQALRERRATPDMRPPGTAAETLRRQAAEAGDAIAEGLTGDDSIRRACGAPASGQLQANQSAHWQCVHAAARERLAAIFARRDPREIEAMPRILMAISPQLLNGSEYVRGSGFTAETNTVRWILAACEFGLDCGPASRAMRWACANYGACGYRHFRDYAADRLLPPATMRMVDGQIPLLVNLILAGDVDSVLGPPPNYGIPGNR
jgi:hypothetical protein